MGNSQSEKIILEYPDKNSDRYLHELFNYEFYNSNEKKFTYYRCLDKLDQILFQATLIHYIEKYFKNKEIQEKAVKQGSMELKVWCDIMNKLSLFNTYKLWRYGHWGESCGRKKVSDKLTDYCVLMKTFKSNRQDTKEKEINLIYNSEKNSIEFIYECFIVKSEINNEEESENVINKGRC